MKSHIARLLLAALLLTTVSCGNAAPQNGTEPTDSALGTEPAESTTNDPYPYPDLDCGGEEFTVLTVAPLWDMNTELDFEAQTGEALDDAIYNRNRTLEEKLNFTMNVIEAPSDQIYSLQDLIRTDVASGDALYDAAYCCGHRIGSLLTENAVMNLFDIPTLQLDQPWWNTVTHEAAVLGKDEAVYFAQSDLNLTAFDLTWCLYFNEDMMEDLNLTPPYDLVRDGKWTLDALGTYTKAAANLNGDDSFAFHPDGKSVYGYTTYYNGALAMLIGEDISFVEKDENGLPFFRLESERFYKAVESVTELMKAEGEFYAGTTGNIDKPEGYMGCFYNRRALFVGAEVKASGVLRNFDDTFGIVPNPKLDENQEEYRSWTNYLSMVLTVPVTSKNPERTGAILDALSYLSYRDVLPVYYDNTIATKGLRNEDSVEMLDIIRDSLFFDPSLAYGWTTELAEAIRDQIFAGNADAASLIAGWTDTVKTQMKDMLKQILP